MKIWRKAFILACILELPLFTMLQIAMWKRMDKLFEILFWYHGGSVGLLFWIHYLLFGREGGLVSSDMPMIYFLWWFMIFLIAFFIQVVLTTSITFPLIKFYYFVRKKRS